MNKTSIFCLYHERLVLLLVVLLMYSVWKKLNAVWFLLVICKPFKKVNEKSSL